MVIIKDTENPFYERLREVAAICDPDVSVHYFVYTPQEFRRLQRSGHFFVNHEIIEKGTDYMKEYEEWIERATEDLALAQIAVQNQFYVHACFLCQLSTNR